MIKRTLYFGNPAYLSLRQKQLVIRIPKDGTEVSAEEVRTIPVEDIGAIVLDHRQITVTQGLLEELLENNCAVMSCDSRHLPTGLMLPLSGNSIQSERFRFQTEASLPLKKQMWQQTVQAKIRNQAAVLEYFSGEVHPNMRIWAEAVRSGDTDNMEARAAAYYWKNVFQEQPGFLRDQDGDGINALLNYGYAILRAVVARALVCSGLLPTLGIHHHNRYNAYCLADDIMEPYRPYVDRLVGDMVRGSGCGELTRENKVTLLGLPVVEVTINDKRSPLMNAVAQTSSSLVKCFLGESRKLVYPDMS
ncbi:MAG: type II CRISPR-associated endonuclease Cas1 [Candidatus Cryptobacteroides sp.]